MMNMKMKLYNDKENYEHENDDDDDFGHLEFNDNNNDGIDDNDDVDDNDDDFVHLELADLRVKGEGVEEHRTDEGDVGRLAGQSIQKLAFITIWMDSDGFSWTIHIKVSFGKLLQFGWIQITAMWVA